jgi:hypothetical protein
LFCAQSNDVIILYGDLNCRGVDGACIDADLALLFDSLGLTQFVACATREDSLLDVFTSSDPITVTNVHVDDAGHLPDHRLVAVRIVATRLKVKVNYIWLNIKALDLTEFERLMRQSVLFSGPDNSAEGFVDQMAAVVTSVLDRLAPIHSAVYRKQKPSSRWLSPEAIAAKHMNVATLNVAG